MKIPYKIKRKFYWTVRRWITWVEIKIAMREQQKQRKQK
jgi:hypothetical protein